MIKSQQRGSPIKLTAAQEAEYWDRVIEGFSDGPGSLLWRQHSDRVNSELLARWLPEARIKRALKTDLFDEAIGDGLYSIISPHAGSFIGVDLSKAAVTRAVASRSRLKGLVADVRRLPFKSASFDFILSNSTLDHFQRAHDIDDALAELNRVLCSGGELVITMDNSRNPILALRRRVQNALLALGVLPYFTGPSYDARGLRKLLIDNGFDVREQTTLLHSPRLPAMAIARMIEVIGMRGLCSAYLSCLNRMERLAITRAANVTGYFVAARAVKH
ncbi:MAG TPA: class I SAM-dependent methyltransferase [Candidatus Binataceae bacterium]|nr:class I SAM-dependent methyltransferase [Candidatus Binataceae bacterium]